MTGSDGTGPGAQAEPSGRRERRDPLSESDRRALMRRVRTRDTAPELRLRKALWAAGVRGWRLHTRGIPGRPDMSWTALKLAVFVDGAFWHGHPNAYHGQSGPFWDTKIAANRARDAETNRRLAQAGWTVLRFWDFEVDRETDRCVESIKKTVERLRSENTRSVRKRR